MKYKLTRYVVTLENTSGTPFQKPNKGKCIFQNKTITSTFMKYKLKRYVVTLQNTSGSPFQKPYKGKSIFQNSIICI
jgi:hypothetical protein